MIFKLFKIAAIWLVGVFVAHHFLEGHYGRRTAELRADDQQRAEDLKKTAASGQMERRMEAHLAVVNRRAEQDKEWEKAWGPGLAAIPKDSRLSIAQMLGALAQGATPKGSKVEVSLDRFTEFVVSVELPAKASTPELATMSARLLEFSTPYLHRVSFFANGRLLGELDAPAIFAATKKSQFSKDIIARSLVASVIDPPPPSGSAPKVPAPSEGTGDGNSPYERIMEDWTDGYLKKFETVNNVVSGINKAVDLQSLKTKGDVTVRLKAIDDVAAQIANLEKYFPTCLETLKTQLAGTVDPLVVTITVRETDANCGGQISQLGPLLSELKSFHEKVRRLLQTLDSPASDWKISERGKIEFANAATLTAFNLRVGDVEASIEKVNAALRAMKTAGKKP